MTDFTNVSGPAPAGAGPALNRALPIQRPPVPVAARSKTNGPAEQAARAITPLARYDDTHRLMQSLSGRQPFFVCVAAHTNTSAVPGISAAGASQELIPFTPAADLEALVYGRPHCLESIPSNPLGPPGPALITRAALSAGSIEWLPVTLGLSKTPDIDVLDVPCAPGGRIDVEDGAPSAHSLFSSGAALGTSLARTTDYLVIGESVPGGTTTSLAVLRQLGLPHRVSGSSATDTTGLKLEVASNASSRAGLPSTAGTLDIVAAVGDPMQPFVAGLIFAAALRVPVVLAGGTQMAAVLAIVDRLEREGAGQLDRSRLLLATTPWVARDPSADLVAILEAAGGWCAAVPELCFTRMHFTPLRHYERFLVKEGVGAGGAVMAALLTGRVTLSGLHEAIDRTYEHFLAEAPA